VDLRVKCLCHGDNGNAAATESGKIAVTIADCRMPNDNTLAEIWGIDKPRYKIAYLSLELRTSCLLVVADRKRTCLVDGCS
jgi:hypothetical protein